MGLFLNKPQLVDSGTFCGTDLRIERKSMGGDGIFIRQIFKNTLHGVEGVNPKLLFYSFSHPSSFAPKSVRISVVSSALHRIQQHTSLESDMVRSVVDCWREVLWAMDLDSSDLVLTGLSSMAAKHAGVWEVLAHLCRFHRGFR